MASRIFSSLQPGTRQLESRGSDNELAYASPVAPYWEGLKASPTHSVNITPADTSYLEASQPRAYRHEAGTLCSDFRKRRYLGCSDDKAETVNGFIKEVNRVGGPYLCSIPVETAREIYKLLRGENIHVSVEICHQRCEVPRHTFPLLSTDNVSIAWEDIQKVIIKSINLSDVMVIGCYRRGRHNSAEHTLPTVLIIVESRSTRKDWQSTREAIVEILDDFKYPNVAVEIVKDELRSDPSTTQGLDPVSLSGTSKAGGSICSGHEERGSWTLGGFVELQSPHTHEWYVHALTCFHCVVPDPATLRDVSPSVVDKIGVWCRDGLRVYDTEAREHLQVHQPTVCALKNTLDRLQKSIQCGISSDSEGEAHRMVSGVNKASEIPALPFRVKTNEAKRLVEEIKACIRTEDHSLGRVVAGSGFGEYLATQSRWGGLVNKWNVKVDWALVEIREGRYPTNALGSDFIRKAPKDHHLDLCKDRLYMQGHCSGRRTEGYYNPQSDYIIDRREVAGKILSSGTVSNSIVGADETHFSAPGDAGALVLTKDRFVVGMVHCRTFFNHITYFTDINDIFYDILCTTEMEDIRMYEK